MEKDVQRVLLCKKGICPGFLMGGTIEALIKMIKDLGADVAGVVALAELSFLKPRERLSEYEVRTLISY